MKLTNCEKNYFTWTGTTEQAAELKAAAADFLQQLKAENFSAERLRPLSDFLAAFDDTAATWEPGRAYRLTGEANAAFFAAGGLEALDICDACGDLYNVGPDYKYLTLTPDGYTAATSRYGALGREADGRNTCTRCAIFHPVTGQFLPTADRVKVCGFPGIISGYFKADSEAWAYFPAAEAAELATPEARAAFIFQGVGADNRAAWLYKRADVILTAHCERRRTGSTDDYGRDIYILSRDKADLTIEQRKYFPNLDKLIATTKPGEFSAFSDGVSLYRAAAPGDFDVIFRAGSYDVLDSDGYHTRSDDADLTEMAESGFILCPCCYAYVPLSRSDYAIINADEAEPGQSRAFRDYPDLCRACIEEKSPSPYKMQSYGTKFDDILDDAKCFCGLDHPRGEFPGIFYGVEFEANTRNDRPRDVRRVLERLDGYVFAKYDGSLDDESGVEFVSAPATLEKQKEIWARLFNVSYARAGVESDKTCKELSAFYDGATGVHIHIDREKLRDTDICHIVYMVNIYKQFCAEIAGRDYYQNQYSRTKWLPTSDAVNTARECLQIEDGHYDAVNLENDSTIEIRIFKANVTMSALFRYLEFTDALVCFSKSLPRLDFSKINPADFMAYCAGKKRYSFLNSFFEQRKEFFKAEKKKALKEKMDRRL